MSFNYSITIFLAFVPNMFFRKTKKLVIPFEKRVVKSLVQYLLPDKMFYGQISGESTNIKILFFPTFC